MIRATALAVVDQALLSAANFLLALALIRFGSQEEYGLYTQLIGLQALFSVLHAGLFVSAFMSTLPRLDGDSRRRYQAGMARAEVVVTAMSAVFVLLATWLAARWLVHGFTWFTSAAAAVALLGLWWREFTRARHFAEARAWSVLRLDAGYVLLLSLFMLALWRWQSISAAAALWSMGLAAMLVTLLPLLRQMRGAHTDATTMRQNLRASWQAARWEISTSLVTWAHAQTFVYFAALQGGLTAAAEISAARLITMPLALVWLSYANVLRPAASRLMASNEPRAKLDRLALRSALFVLGLAASYGLLLLAGLPLIEKYLFGVRFAHLGPLSMLWLLYFALTGMTTIATCLLRSALEFKALFRVHALCGGTAVLAFVAGLGFETPLVFVVVLIVVEALLATLCWRLVRQRVGDTAPVELSRAQKA